MAEEFLQPIYEEAQLLWELREVVEIARSGDSHHFGLLMNKVLPRLVDMCKGYLDHDKEKGKALWELVKKISAANNDVVVMGDLIQHEIIPAAEERMQMWGTIETENEEGDYLFETSVSGFLTVKDEITNNYLHSKVDPMWEARKRAEIIFDPKNDSYSILGCGLGYLAYQLYLLTDGSVKIHIFEKDARMVEYARNYGVLDWIPEECLEVNVYTDILDFLNSAVNLNVGYYIFPQALKREDDNIRGIIEKVCVAYNTSKYLKREREINVWRNISSGNKTLWDFDTSKISKEFIVIAAGPSLDENLDFLRANQGKRTLVAVGTVFRKLIDCGITPDIVVISDPQARTYKQIEGLEEQKVPLFIGMSAYWKFAAAYQGDKYMIPTMDMEEIHEYAKEKNLELCRCGGTVMVIAVEIANRLGAESIYLVGVDLAYPNGVSHATGTLDRKVRSTEGLLEVDGVHNTKVYATRVFITYREDLEKLIKLTPQITYYNMSNIGVEIEGTEDGTKLLNDGDH